MSELAIAGERPPAQIRWTQTSFTPRLVAVLAACAAGITAAAYWPGLMSWDAVRQYGEALSGQYEDWHPPLMQWIWHQFSGLLPGPAPMMLLQLALYWGSLLWLATSFVSRGRPRLGMALLACGLCPLGMALTGMVLKDALMTGALLTACGAIAARSHDVGARPVAKALILAAGLVALGLAASLRFNAFLATAPLLVALLPHRLRDGHLRLGIATTLALAASMAVMPLVNRLVGASPTGVERSLVIFDLGGITEYSGTSVFPEELEVSDAVRVNHGCYNPVRWDSYSDWVDPECPLGFTAWDDNIDPPDMHPIARWTSAIAAHPFAYAFHRITHFALATRVLPVSQAIERPIPRETAPNPWGYRTAPNALSRAFDALNLVLAQTPFGWPIVWIALAASALIASWRTEIAGLAVPIAMSSIAYGGGYLVFGVAAELRYHLWTGIAALIAIVLAAGTAQCRTGPRLVFAALPVAAVLVICLAARL